MLRRATTHLFEPSGPAHKAKGLCTECYNAQRTCLNHPDRRTRAKGLCSECYDAQEGQLSLSVKEKRGLEGILTTLGKEDISWVFREPVDPVILGIPTYFDIIKHPRDLHTIRNWLDSDKYATVQAFQADIQLMVDNAVTFNGLGSEVGALAIGLQDGFRELLSKWRAGAGKKRKDGEKMDSQPLKKLKIT
ncbi:Bromodomain-containing protein [Mycena haematopus]|nr:Bromodomain-containing protein [Mycena haematopus]